MKSMRFKVYLTFLLALMMWVPRSFAEPLEIAPVLAELKQAAAETETLTSNFVQEKNLSIFSEKLLSQGRFAYQKPDRLRWELVSPVASGFVLHGKQGKRWNGLSREQGSFSVENDLIMGMIAQQLLAWARVDLEWLQNRYQMELLSTEPVSLRLYPRDAGEAEFIEYLQILFAKNRSHVAEVLMVEKEGDSTRLSFTDVRINSELAPAVFTVPNY